MGKWNYRIVQYKNNEGFGLHEVFYDKDGKPWGMTEAAAVFVCDATEGPEGIKGSLSMARADAIKHPVFIVPDIWPGTAP